MKYRISTYTGVISSVDENSAIARSLRRIEIFCSYPKGLFGTTWNKQIPVTLEYARSDRFEVLKISFDKVTYFNVKDSKFVLECSSTSVNCPREIHLSKISDVSRGYRPPCIGFVLPGSESTFFTQGKNSAIFPGDGCTQTSAACQEFIYLDADNGNLAKVGYSSEHRLLTLEGSGYMNHDRSWLFDGKDIRYVEKDGRSIVGEANWKFVSKKDEDRSWDSFKDFVDPKVDFFQFERSPGSYGGKSLADLLILDKSARAIQPDKNLQFQIGSTQSQSSKSPVVSIVVGTSLMIVFSTLAILLLRRGKNGM